MNNDPHRLLDQLRAELDALRGQVSTLTAHLDELQQALDTPAVAEEKTVDLSDVSFDAIPVDDLPAGDGKVAEPAAVPEEPVEEIVVMEEEPVPDLPAVEEAPVPVAPVPEKPVTKEPEKPVAQEKPAPAKPSPRESTDRYAWRKDLPGAPVRDIRSAIGLNDRVLLINTLFQQDAVRFQNTLNALNALGSLSEAEDYLLANFPQWNLDSEVVYRFMMAVRRKLR